MHFDPIKTPFSDSDVKRIFGLSDLIYKAALEASYIRKTAFIQERPTRHFSYHNFYDIFYFSVRSLFYRYQSQLGFSNLSAICENLVDYLSEQSFSLIVNPQGRHIDPSEFNLKLDWSVSHIQKSEMLPNEFRSFIKDVVEFWIFCLTSAMKILQEDMASTTFVD